MVLFLLLAGVIALALIYFIYFVVELRKVDAILRPMPGPEPIPFFGNILDFQQPPEEIFKLLNKYNKQYGPTYKMYTGFYPLIFSSSPEDAEVIISGRKNLEKHMLYFLLQVWLGEGLLTSKDKEWHMKRKLLTPTFHFNILKQFTTTFIENNAEMLQEIEGLVGEIVDIDSLAMKHTLVNVCETAMGASIDPEQTTKYSRALHNMVLLATHRIVRPWFYFWCVYAFSPKCYQTLMTSRFLQNCSRRIIKQRKASFNRDTVTEFNLNVDEDVVYKKKKRLAMLDMLLYAHSNGEINEEQIREEVDTFIFEGHDTTSSCLSFTLMLLACNRDVQDKVVEELHQLLPNKEDELSFNTINNMKYLERVIKESLRLYPSVPMFGRILNETVTTHQGYTIPAGVNYMIRVYDLHRNPDLYPDPEKFDPDRFLPDRIGDKHPFAYLPFSAGPRNCIGQKFAMLELKAMIAGILRNFQVFPVDTPDTVVLVMDFVMRAKDGIKIKFMHRK